MKAIPLSSVKSPIQQEAENKLHEIINIVNRLKKMIDQLPISIKELVNLIDQKSEDSQIMQILSFMSHNQPRPQET